jgi:hypothetical protein
MKASTKAGLGYFAIAALISGAMAIPAAPANAGNAYGRDGNPGNATGHAEGGPAGTNNGNGNLASAMGSLNAAHASANGLAHANRAHSRVGKLAAYMDAMAVYETAYADVTEADWIIYNDLMDDIAALDPDSPTYDADKAALQAEADLITAAIDAAATDAAGNLEDAANKDGLIDATVVDAVNSLLDGKSDDFTHSTVVHDSEDDIVEIINPSE